MRGTVRPARPPSQDRPADGSGTRRGRVGSAGLNPVNGFLLGRYWKIEPEATLHCPAPLLRPRTNTVTVLELRAGLELGPPEEYIEELGRSAA
ncbi:hypothetical protein [Actinoplanes subtropicus]|uniref:hypothetical protein n=1 Tax=Actinoplanes subtropicus TaxID=543632 RepID=UPI00316AE9EF